jgi:hypothetical protein
MSMIPRALLRDILHKFMLLFHTFFVVHTTAHENNLNMAQPHPTSVSPPGLGQLVRRQEQQWVVHVLTPTSPKC